MSGIAMNIIERVAESNRIEGITRPPTRQEIDEHVRFVNLVHPTIEDLAHFVSIYQPGANIRDKMGLNVQIAACGRGG